jgi:hypothetical protein
MKEKPQHIMLPFFIGLVSPGLERPAPQKGPAYRAYPVKLSFFETFMLLTLCLKKILFKKEMAERVNVEIWT